MSISFKERFARVLHPYLMVLRQGGKKPDDLFDFSLALLHRHAGETLPRPNARSPSPPTAPIPEVNKTPKATNRSRKKKEPCS